MKKITPLLLACAIFLIAANPPPVSVFGPCQRRCVKQFGEIQKRHTNIDTQFLYTNVSNRTEFSLCKLGCSSPEYTELHLPAFRFGQIAYEEILNSISPTALIHLPNPVKDVQILCLDKSPANPNSSKNSTQQKLTGNILLKFDDELEALENVYFIEVVASDEEQTILFQDWCYSSLCNISFLAPENAQIRARLSSFDENGAIGGIVHSSWYPISEEPNLDMKVVSLDWLDDKAAAKIQLIPKNQISKCSLQIEFKNELTADFKTAQFSMDQTRHVILKKLEFGKRYEARFGENQGKLTRFDVPQCREMVDDMTMCAPPPVSALQTHWNVTNPNGYALMITWTYMTDQENISLTETNAKLSMSHFKLQLNPLITPDNEKCEKLESIRRDVTWTHRQVQFYVPDAECNYEAEISAVDSKQRQSENKKIKISRINEPSTMNLLFLRSDLSISIGFIGILIVLMLLAFLLMVFVVQRGRKTAPKVVEEYAPPGDRLVYAYVDSNDSSKTIIGVRNLSNRSEPPKYEPTTQIDSYLRNTLHIYHNNDDDSYETIPDYRNISISSETSSQAEPYYSPPQHRMDQIITPAISNIEQYNLIKSRAIQDFQLTKICVPEGNPAWRMINVLDVIGGGSFAMKFAKDSTLETQQSMKKEIEILSNLHYHPNFVRFEGLVTKRIGGIVNIIGLLMENCRGGSLRQYIQSVGSQLRRQAMSTPMSDSPPSSGYDSLNRHEKLSSEISSVMTTDNSVANMSLRFCQFSEQIGAALEHLHRYGIIHTRVTTIAIYLVKDFINPLDVLCDQTVKLGDFGMSASSADEAHVDQTVMPPEVCIGKKYEAEGDIWQFGTCLVEMCSLGVSYQMQKEIPTSGIEEFDKLPATKVLHDAAKKCLNLRNRPSASDLRAVFQTDTARDLRTLAIANLEKHNQSLLV